VAQDVLAHESPAKFVDMSLSREGLGAFGIDPAPALIFLNSLIVIQDDIRELSSWRDLFLVVREAFPCSPFV